MVELMPDVMCDHIADATDTSTVVRRPPEGVAASRPGAISHFHRPGAVSTRAVVRAGT